MLRPNAGRVPHHHPTTSNKDPANLRMQDAPAPAMDTRVACVGDDSEECSALHDTEMLVAVRGMQCCQMPAQNRYSYPTLPSDPSALVQERCAAPVRLESVAALCATPPRLVAVQGMCCRQMQHKTLPRPLQVILEEINHTAHGIPSSLFYWSCSFQTDVFHQARQILPMHVTISFTRACFCCKNASHPSHVTPTQQPLHQSHRGCSPLKMPLLSHKRDALHS